MKKLLVLSFAFAAFTMSVSAQEKRELSTDQKAQMENHHRGDHKDMMKDLNLSDAQKAQLKAVREDKSLSREDRKSKMENIFTPAQKSQLAQKRAAMDSKRDDMHAQKSGEMQTKLGLNNDQAAKLKTLNESNHAQMKAIKENTSLSADAKKAQMKALKQSSDQQRKSILTADQIKKMQEMKKAGKGKRHGKMNKQTTK